MTHSPLLSIIIPLFNKVDSVQRCVASIIEQDYQDYELIIIDDGSTDGSADLVKEVFSDVVGWADLEHSVDSLIDVINNAAIRNYERWPRSSETDLKVLKTQIFNRYYKIRIITII